MSRSMMSEELYNKIKQLSEHKDAKGHSIISPKQIVTILGTSPATVGRVRQSKDYTDYKAIIYVSSGLKKKKEQEAAKVAEKVVAPVIGAALKPLLPTPDPAAVTNAKHDRIIALLIEQKETIDRMNESLTWISEHAVLEVTKKKRFF